ncbi:MAG: hypothetical protein OXH47_01030 [Paracoccaceae bacterium]|nr:hypothetical protein [Paracoccaceae bacterium]
MPDDRVSDTTREKLLLESGRSEYLSQEGTNNELSVKAGSIFLFTIAISGIGISFMDLPHPNVVAVIVILQISAGILLACIVWPRSWRRPFDLKIVHDTLYDYKPEAIMLALGKGYADTVAKNRLILNDRAKYLSWLTGLGIVLSLFVVFVIANQNWEIVKFPSSQ